MSQTLNIPAGYELDLENSTSTNVVLKKVEKLPNTWAEVRQIEGYHLLCGKAIHHMEWAPLPVEEVVGDKRYQVTIGHIEMTTPVFATKEQAEAMQALAKLTHLVKMYNNEIGYKSKDFHIEWAANFSNMRASKIVFFHTDLLTFYTLEKAELFLKNFKDLIIQAKPLIL